MRRCLFAAVVLLCGALVVSCDYFDKVEDIEAGMFYESFWSSRPAGSTELPYYTMKFSGTSHCRLRCYVAEGVDIDRKVYYGITNDAPDGICEYAVTDFKTDYAYFHIVNDSTLTLKVDGCVYTMYKQGR